MTLGLLFAALAAAQPVTVAPTPASAAAGLFEQDWVLMGWALKLHDGNGDRILGPEEAAGAASQFRGLADADGDGRVSPLEFRQARDFILARY